LVRAARSTDARRGADANAGQDPHRAAGGGRTRNIDARAQALAAGLRADELAAPDAVVSAFAATTRAAAGVIGELNRLIAALEAELADHFEQHPDADIYLSQPGIGVTSRRPGARRVRGRPEPV
jgi:hypothetical protein